MGWQQGPGPCPRDHPVGAPPRGPPVPPQMVPGRRSCLFLAQGGQRGEGSVTLALRISQVAFPGMTALTPSPSCLHSGPLGSERAWTLLGRPGS